MQRSNAAVSVEVKQVIGSLCKLLAASGLSAVPAPETFRRAKFCGGPEVEDDFWQLLANILQKTATVSSDVCTQKRGGLDHRKLVAGSLWQTGYRVAWLCGRGGGNRISSSRDLLLALGWLLATGTLERLLTQRVLQLNTVLLTSTLANPQIPHEVQLDSASLRRLHWLIGCLRAEGRILLSMQEERAQLLHAVLSASLSSSVSFSSANQSCTMLKEECVHMRELCDLLEAYLNWTEKEGIFWSWMDSVVEYQLTDPATVAPAHAANMTNAVCYHENQGSEKTEGVLMKLLTTQVYRAKLCADRPAGSSRGGAAAADELQVRQAARLLLQEETWLSESSGRRRAARRTQLQQMTERLEGMVLIPQTIFNKDT
ncbi:hypothetical protein LDENG_00144260 [Lucifuga dentata]|nr:hypothetical protein LDENG_00144260 [Lucifuga dentata]